MKFKHRLADHWVAKVSSMREFADGAAQVSFRLKDGRTVRRVLVSNALYIVAARGFEELPFGLDEISDIFQADDDVNPHERTGWDYWDDRR